MAKVKLFAHFIRRGWGPRIAYRLACNRYNDTNLATRMLKSNVLSGGQK